MQRWINDYEEEALLAILPGVALSKLWELLGSVEDIKGDFDISIYLVIAWIKCHAASFNERTKDRNRNPSKHRAPPTFILGLLVFESMLIVTIGIV